jgi:hypothetical protein
MHGPGVVDAAFNDHIDIKIVAMEIKKLHPVVDFDQFHAVAAPELLYQKFFLFSDN